MDKLSLSSRVGFLALGGFISQIGVLLGSILLARFLTQESYGTYRQVQLLYQIASPVFLAALPGSLLYFLPIMDKEKRKIFVSQTIMLLSGLGVVLGLITMLTAGFISKQFQNPDLYQLLFIYSLFPPAAFIGSYFSSYLVVEGRVKLIMLITMVSALLSFFGIVANVLLNHSLATIFFTQMAITTLISLFSLAYTQKTLGLSFRINFASIKKQLFYSFPLGLAAVTATLAWQTDRLIVSLFFDPALYAIYVVGAMEIPFLARINTSINTILIPEVSSLFQQNKRSEIMNRWSSTIRKTSLIMFPSFVFLTIFSQELLTLLYSEKYIESVPLFRIYLLLLPLRIATYGLIFQAIGKTKFILYGSILYLIVNVILNLLLYKPLGLIGPPIATVIATFLFAIYYLVALRSTFQVSITKLLPWRAISGIFTAAAFAGIFVVPFFFFELPTPVLLVISGATYIITYSTLLYFFKLLTAQDINFLKTWISLKVLKGHG